jgi:hypothetical protein
VASGGAQSLAAETGDGAWLPVVTAGALTRLVTITAWIAHAGQETLELAGCRHHLRDGLPAAPPPETVTRCLGLVGAKALAGAVSRYLAAGIPAAKRLGLGVTDVAETIERRGDGTTEPLSLTTCGEHPSDPVASRPRAQDARRLGTGSGAAAGIFAGHGSGCVRCSLACPRP